MRDIGRRLKKAEEKLSINREPRTVTIVDFSGELPPDHTNGNMTFHYVRYADICKDKEQQ